MATPLVTIVINNFNYQQFIGQAIESALAQTYRNVEVIVVDDGSTDNSRDIIRTFGQDIIAEFKPNGGQSSTFNAGFARSRGELICFLDADDLFELTKVERIVEVYDPARHGWCFHRLEWVDRDAKIIEGVPTSPFASGTYDFRAEFRRGGCKFWPPATSGLAFQRQLLEKLLPMPQEIRITSDNYLKFSALALSAGYFINESLALQRIHGANLYTQKKDPALIADVQVLTAKGLRERLPELRTIGNRLFARGLAGKWKAGAKGRDVSRELMQYLANLPMNEQASVLLRVAVNAVSG